MAGICQSVGFQRPIPFEYSLYKETLYYSLYRKVELGLTIIVLVHVPESTGCMFCLRRTDVVRRISIQNGNRFYDTLKIINSFSQPITNDYDTSCNSHNNIHRPISLAALLQLYTSCTGFGSRGVAPWTPVATVFSESPG